MGSGSLCCFSLTVFHSLGEPKPSRVVFSAGKFAVFAGKQGEINASRATQRTVPCVFTYRLLYYLVIAPCVRRSILCYQKNLLHNILDLYVNYDLWIDLLCLNPESQKIKVMMCIFCHGNIGRF